MFGRIGVSELLIILVVVLIFFGPAKLPALAKSMGQAVSEFRKGAKEISKEFEEAAVEEKEVEKLKKEYKEICDLFGINPYLYEKYAK